MRCPNCNALNPDGARWCSLCLAPFGQPGPAAPALLDPPAAALDDPQAEASPGPPLRKAEEGMFWRCPNCDRENPIDENRCAVCGVSFFDAVGLSAAVQPSPLPKRNPRVAAALSVVPGAGHLYLGRPADGAVRILLGAWWLGIAAVMRGASLLPVRVLFLAAGLALVAVCGAEAFRQAQHPQAPALLTRKMILYTSLGLTGALMVGTILAVVAARR